MPTLHLYLYRLTNHCCFSSSYNHLLTALVLYSNNQPYKIKTLHTHQKLHCRVPQVFKRTKKHGEGRGQVAATDTVLHERLWVLFGVS